MSSWFVAQRGYVDFAVCVCAAEFCGDEERVAFAHCSGGEGVSFRDGFGGYDVFLVEDVDVGFFVEVEVFEYAFAGFDRWGVCWEGFGDYVGCDWWCCLERGLEIAFGAYGKCAVRLAITVSVDLAETLVLGVVVDFGRCGSLDDYRHGH